MSKIITTKPGESRQKKTGTCRIMNFAVHRVKLKEIEKMNIWTLLKKLKKTMKHESDGDTNFDWCTWNNPQRIVKKTGRLEN